MLRRSWLVSMMLRPAHRWFGGVGYATSAKTGMTEKAGQNDRTVTPAIYPMNQLRELLIHPTGLLPDGYFLAAPMRNFLVPQTVHWPVTAGRPFFKTTSRASRVSVLLRHLKQ